MRLRLVAAPLVHPVTLEEVRADRRVDESGSPSTNPDDALLEALIASATAEIDGPTGWLGRALVEQTWEAVFDAFDDTLALPLPPLIEVLSVTYRDGDNAAQTLATSIYEVNADGVAPSIALAYGQAWPATYTSSAAVVVRFRCGYEGAGSPPDLRANVPGPVKTWIKRRVGQLYEERETPPKPEFSLLAGLRVRWGFA